jgi:SAM-dependent methyltransferase
MTRDIGCSSISNIKLLCLCTSVGGTRDPGNRAFMHVASSIPSAEIGQAQGDAMPWNAVVERLAAMLLAPGAAANVAMFARGLLAPAPYPSPILDVGCGSRSPLAAMRAIGVDIVQARARSRRPLGIVADAAALPFSDGAFPAVFSFGLLHELPDEAARRTIGEMMRVARFEGRVAIFDSVRPDEGTRPLAALIRRLDGPHTRTERELRRLFDGRPTWHFERVTYAATGLEGLWCVSRGEA